MELVVCVRVVCPWMCFGHTIHHPSTCTQALCGEQGRLEDVAFQLRIPQRKPWQAMADNVAAASAAVAQRDKARLSFVSAPSCHRNSIASASPFITLSVPERCMVLLLASVINSNCYCLACCQTSVLAS